jgi:3-hydroxyacyl-CoA dehydrogenase
MQNPDTDPIRHIEAAERAVYVAADDRGDVSQRPVRKVGIVGAGTMGCGITMAFLNARIPVVLIETQDEQLEKGLTTIRSNYRSAVNKGRLSDVDVEERISLISPSLDFGSLGSVDLVIEAVFEDMAVKEQVFRRLDQVCRPGAILASNTSYLDIDRIAGFTERPEDILGLHFFSPANVMRLLEVVRGAKTAPDVLATCLRLATTIGKLPVVAGVCDGFIGNRMVARYAAAAAGLIEAGASPQQVDGALQEFGMAMGPFRMADLAGLDVSWANRKRRAAEAGGVYASVVADSLCESGRFGQKTGAGWYRYEAGSRVPIPDPATERIIEQFRAARGIKPRRISAAEIVERCIFALVNEGARILADGIAARSSDIDLVYVNGYGFPKDRGGPMFYADTVGLQNVVDSLRRLASQPGAEAWWHPAPLLLSLAADGKFFSGERS